MLSQFAICSATSLPMPSTVAQLAPLRRQNPLRRFENLEQLAQPHRPHPRDHVERDAGLGAVHGMQPKFRGFSLGARFARSDQNGISSSSGWLAGAFFGGAELRPPPLGRERGASSPSSGPPPPPAPRGEPSNCTLSADDLELVPLLAGGFVFPGIELEAAFDEDGPAFLEIFAGDFRRPSPNGDVDESDFFAFLAVLAGVVRD